MNPFTSTMPREHLWVGKLSKNEKETVFCPDDDTEVESVSHSLLVKWIMLGPSANVDEVNIVKINTTASGALDSEISAPLCGLMATKEKRYDQVMLDILVPNSKIKFTLSEGNGPVTIYGQHVPEFSHPEVDSEDENVEEEEEDEDTEDVASLMKKRKNASNSEPPSKLAKLTAEQEDDDEELESDAEDDDSSDYEPSGKPANSRKILKAKRVTKAANPKKVK